MSESGKEIQGIMNTTMENLRTMADADTVIGNPITVAGATVIPVSKLSIGLATGGTDLSTKPNKELFAGGGGAGISVTPIAFLVVQDGDVKMMQVYKESSTADKAIGLLPDLFDKVTAMFKKKKEDKNEVAADEKIAE